MDVKVIQANFSGLIGCHKRLIFLSDVTPLKAIDINEKKRRILYDVVHSQKHGSFVAIFAGIVLCFLGFERFIHQTLQIFCVLIFFMELD